eukprot:TRINITY_DN7637_c0_g1_i1.p1 TRINITY_DN7637_c0_g1~~TRINITY_DN7637_c0_g1_i1.p1  ORF type:complete len:449 (+),score=71.61 TRINITY_DN7637_c0_g1_i1:87-1349(+)
MAAPAATAEIEVTSAAAPRGTANPVSPVCSAALSEGTTALSGGNIHRMGTFRSGASRLTMTIPDVRVGGRFRMLERIGAGSFGELFRGCNIETGEAVAIKLEPTTTRQPQLLEEARIAKLLGPDGPPGVPPILDSHGIPRVHWYGLEGDYHVMVQTLLGPSIEDLLNYCGRRFSLKTVCSLGRQMVSRLEYMHSKHMVHRDIKPDNFLTGTGRRAGTVYLIDFGLAKPYRDPKTLVHIPYRTGKGLSGTARYASRNVHLGIEQSRRDDLEAIGYVMVYMLRGALPWQGVVLPAKDQDDSPGSPKRGAKDQKQILKTQAIGQCKLNVSFSALCSGLPPEFVEYLRYCSNLRFTDKPDYDRLRALLHSVEQRNGFEDDGEYDWVLKYRCTAASQGGSPVLSPAVAAGAGLVSVHGPGARYAT